MASIPKLSTIISWLFYLVPLYIFIGVPILRQIFPGETPDTDDLDDSDTPSLHLSDDSFVSPEDGVPLNCPGSGDYRVHILAVEPLVIYIEDFLKDWEADHLVNARCVLPLVPFTTSYMYTRWGREKKKKRLMIPH